MAAQPPSASLLLAENYRRSSNTLRAAYMRDMLSLYPLLRSDADGVDESTIAPWLRLVILLVQRYRTLDGVLAQQYVTTARLVEVGSPGPRVPPADMPDEQIVRTLYATGPNQIERRLALGFTEPQARAGALRDSLGAGSRLVLDGGRDVVERTVRADDAAFGWIRVTDGDPCAFCAMLASRGAVDKKGRAVYATREAAGADDVVPVEPVDQLVPGEVGFTTSWHDDCGCQVVPIWSSTPDLPATNVAAERLWITSTTGLPNAERMNAYRRAIEGRVVEGDPLHGKPYAMLATG